MTAALILFVVMLFTGLPLYVNLGLCSFLYVFIENLPMEVVVQRITQSANSFTMIAAPFFILMGNLMNTSGVTRKMFNFANTIVGTVPGGMGHANIIGSALFAGMSGTAVADAGGLGNIEIQAMKDIEALAGYCRNPLPSTVLVLYFHGASPDKRKELYKTVKKNGAVLESAPVRDYEMSRWIVSFFNDKGLEITPDAAALLAEFAGADLNKISIETDKMRKNLPEDKTLITAADIENNVGISRQYSIFELTKELSMKNTSKALKIAAYVGNAPKFMMLMATAPLFNHFYRILRYEALMMGKPGAGSAEKAAVLGVSPYFLREYETAAANYPPRKCLSVISLIKEYDFKGKGGNSGEARQSELLMELVAKILNC